MKQQQLATFLCTVVLTVASVMAQEKPTANTPAELYGTWSGSWEGMGQSGGFELTLEKPKDKDWTVKKK